MQPPGINIKKLSKSFGDLKAVDALTLDIHSGEIFGFLGPNGAGKTTTIQMICGLLPSDSGLIEYYSGTGDVFSVGKASIGLCPQENYIWPKLSCREQLKFMAFMHGMDTKTASGRSDFLLKHMGLEHKSAVLASKLSGGMKRRLNICLALVHDPEILILDEPGAGLDPQSRLLVRSYIKSLAGEKTILISTHNMDEADRLSDRVAIIDHGKLLMVDTPANLKNSIGEGDILEISMHEQQGAELEELKKQLLKICSRVSIGDSKILLRSVNLVALMPEIFKMFEKHRINIKETILRENSLEDVFIHLTGRTLRQ